MPATTHPARKVNMLHFSAHTKSKSLHSAVIIEKLANLEPSVAAAGITLTELARSTKITTATITGLVDSLVKCKLIKRRPCRQDRRKTYVTLRPEAEKYLT